MSLPTPNTWNLWLGYLVCQRGLSGCAVYPGLLGRGEGGDNLFTWGLKAETCLSHWWSEMWWWKKHPRDATIWDGLHPTGHRWLCRWRKAPRAKECRWHPDARKARKQMLPESPQKGRQPSRHLDCSPARPRQTPELHNETTCVSKATDFVVNCYSNGRKPIQSWKERKNEELLQTKGNWRGMTAPCAIPNWTPGRK